MKSESDADTLVEVSGQDEARRFSTRVVHLPAQKRVTFENPFYSVTSIHIKNMPTARLGIHSAVYKEAHIISPLEWGNIWVYGMDITLAGYISRAEFRQRARLVPSNSRVFQYDHTKTKNLAMTVSNLNPCRIFLRACGNGSHENCPIIDHNFPPCLSVFKVILSI
ncbi:hypothetical protein [Candidatus Villigracilis saccharophilus]|uniref:hypothetical protein n=1 Tax=Candidatus Villigracilis saccharophilus TaxID=3140684 RepID=UPI003136E5F6|nr:hypothetical protein [Anaerolineales bacterium]